VRSSAASRFPVESMDPYRDAASRLIGAALADRFAWERLAGRDRHDRSSPERIGPARARVQWALEKGGATDSSMCAPNP
jgi:hypothetical protein